MDFCKSASRAAGSLRIKPAMCRYNAATSAPFGGNQPPSMPYRLNWSHITQDWVRSSSPPLLSKARANSLLKCAPGTGVPPMADVTLRSSRSAMTHRTETRFFNSSRSPGEVRRHSLTALRMACRMRLSCSGLQNAAFVLRVEGLVERFKRCAQCEEVGRACSRQDR